MAWYQTCDISQHCAVFQASTPTLVAIVRNGGSPPTLGTLWMERAGHVGEFQMKTLPALPSDARSHGIKHVLFSGIMRMWIVSGLNPKFGRHRTQRRLPAATRVILYSNGGSPSALGTPWMEYAYGGSLGN